MRLRRPTAASVGDGIVPMIDVVFFLLVFFLLVGRLEATAPFELVPPGMASAPDLPAGGVVLSLASDGALGLDGQAVGQAPLLEELAARLEDQPALRIRVEADRDAPLRDLLPLIAALEDIGARDVLLAVKRDAR